MPGSRTRRSRPSAIRRSRGSVRMSSSSTGTSSRISPGSPSTLTSSPAPASRTADTGRTMTLPVEEVVPGAGNLGVLLLHGLTGTSAEMAPVAEALAGRFPLYVARIAGHETSVAELARTSWSDWYASAIAGADALARVTPRIAVVGLSMGAMLAVRLAVERRTQVAGVALLSPAIALGRPWLRRLGAGFRALAALDTHLPPLQR